MRRIRRIRAVLVNHDTSPHTEMHARAFAWLLAQVVRTSPRVCAVWLAGSLVSGALIPAQLWLTRALVNALAAQLRGQPDPYVSLWLALLAAAVVAERIIAGTEGWLSAELREQAGATVRESVMRRASQLPAAAFENQAYYDRLSRVMGDAEQRVPAAMGQSLSLARRVPHLLGYGAGLFAVSPVLLGVTLLAWAPSIVVFFRAGQSHFGLLRERTPAIRLADWYDGALRWRGSAKEVRLYQLRDYLLGRWEALYWQTRNEQRALAFRLGLRQQGTVLVSETASVFGLLAVVAAGWVRGGRRTLGRAYGRKLLLSEPV